MSEPHQHDTTCQGCRKVLEHTAAELERAKEEARAVEVDTIKNALGMLVEAKSWGASLAAIAEDYPWLVDGLQEARKLERSLALNEASKLIETEADALRAEFPEVQGVAFDIVGKWIRAIRTLDPSPEGLAALIKSERTQEAGLWFAHHIDRKWMLERANELEITAPESVDEPEIESPMAQQLVEAALEMQAAAIEVCHADLEDDEAPEGNCNSLCHESDAENIRTLPLPPGTQHLLDGLLDKARLEEAKWRLNHWPPLGALQSMDSLRQWITDRQVEQQHRISELEFQVQGDK